MAIFADTYGLAILFSIMSTMSTPLVVKQENMDEVEPSFNLTKKCMSITKSIDYEEAKDIVLSVPNIGSGLSSEKQENSSFNATKKIISIPTKTIDVDYYEKMNERESVPLIVKQENMDAVDPPCNDTNKIVTKTKTSVVDCSKEMEDISVPNSIFGPFSGPENVDIAKLSSEASEKIMSISKSTTIVFYKKMIEVRTFMIVKKCFFKVRCCIMLVFYLFI